MTARQKQSSAPPACTKAPAAFLLLAVALASAGGDFFESKPTEIESRRILRDLETVRETPDIDMPRPGMYTDPPQIVQGTISGKPDAKLYYFAKYQTVDRLLSLFNEQFVKTLNDNEGNPLPAVPYTADINPATHQIIVSCPTVENAREVLYFFEQVDVVPVQVRIDCLISEVYADHTLDWETRLEIQNLLGIDVDLVGKLPGAALRDIARSTFGLKAGYVEGGTYDGTFTAIDQGHMFGVLVDALVSRGYLKILMNPCLEVVNGQKALIRTKEYVTIDQIRIAHGDDVVLSPRRYTITDSLEVTPQVFSDGTIGLKTEAVIGSKATPEGVKQIPIATERKITISENRLRPGESLLIGGITKAEQRSVVRGVPGLKDIPLLGILFSSKDFEERAKEVLFILTPAISTGGRPNKDVTANIQRKQTPVKNSDLIENLKDPLGTGAYTELVEEEAIQAEVARVRAEMEKVAAERRNEELLQRIAAAAQRLEEEKRNTERASAAAQAAVAGAAQAAEAARQEAEQAKARAAEAARLAEEERARAAAAAAEKQKALEEAERAAAQAAAAQAALEKARAEAAAAKAAADKARKDAEEKLAEWLKNQPKSGQPAPKLDNIP
ncbi:MAG: type II secretion system protein GspD [Anaerohalosphaeraceae bacterium]|jgi:Flp pilus assembly secretin CpaC